ncbi:MAG: hypothetical protein U9R47_01905, partial [Actinomycetota bacterium]|nr:hypothetical protein [Actinomycetota bacterium]
MTTATYDFNTETSTKALDVNVPQKAGRALWAPAFAMSLVGFAAGMILAIVKATAIADGDAVLAASLNNYGIAAMFFGFTMVFTGISFAIARILGEFRVGGGRTQEAAGSEVKTLKMPATAKAFIGLMAMAMMILMAAVIGHVVVGVQINAETLSLVDAEQWDIWLEAARRFAVQLYLFAIALGLGTIIYVIRYQSIRIREIAKA